MALVVLAASYILVTAWLLQVSATVASGVLIAHVLALGAVPLLLWLNRSEERRPLRTLLLVALFTKLIGTLARYAVLANVYGGEGDARQYDEVGAQLAEMFRRGDFAVDVGKVVGTGFIEILTGVVYAISGSTMLGGFLIYSLLGFWGLYLFYAAFLLACPGGDARRYALLLFFLPSMLFWPSSIGKEAWMTLMLGAIAYGAARICSHHRHGLVWILLGVGGSAMVRPHVTVIAVASLMLAYLLKGSRRSSFGHPMAKGAGIVVLAVVFAFAFNSMEGFLGLDESTSVEQVIEKKTERTAKGGSEFDSPGAATPADLPLAIFSVLFRPLPFEAGNPLALFTSLEGTFLLFYFVRNWRRLRNFVPSRRSPYLAFIAAYSLVFVVAFSNINNFGILARQRTQLFPLLLVALAVPVLGKTRSTEVEPEQTSSDVTAPQPRRAVGASAGAGG